MSENLLVERLKFAKRELTALKTAHIRSSQLLRIYQSEYKYTDFGFTPDRMIRVKITVQFSENFAKYPFCYFYGKCAMSDGALLYAFNASQVAYSDDGFGIVAYGTAFFYMSTNPALDGFFVCSSAPIKAVSCVRAT